MTWDPPPSPPPPGSWPPPDHGGQGPAGGPPPPGYAPPGPGGSPPFYGYGYGPGYGSGAQVEHPQTGTVLALGIVSVLLCQALGPVAWVMGNNALREIDTDPNRYANRSNVQVGRVLGIVATAILGVVLAGFFVFFLLAIFVGTTVSEMEPGTTTLRHLTWMR